MNTVHIPVSKSEAQRAILLGSVFGLQFQNNIDINNDILDSINFAKALGAKFDKNYNIIPGGAINDNINITESATSLRMGAAIMLAILGSCHIHMSSSLSKRPISDFSDFLLQYGITSKLSNDTFIAKGKLLPGKYKISDCISSQFLSGIMLALSVNKGKSEIYFENIPSFQYIHITEYILKQFGIEIKINKNKIFINSESPKQANIRLHSDWSSASPFIIAKAMGYSVNIKGYFDNLHPDSSIITILKNIGFLFENNKIIKNNILKPVVIDANEVPDLIPVLSILLSKIDGLSIIKNAKRLQYKESDRFLAIYKILNSLGVDVKIDDNNIYINGKNKKFETSSIINYAADHRIAMMLALANLNSANELHIKNKECVNKSYPNFWEDFSKIEV